MYKLIGLEVLWQFCRHFRTLGVYGLVVTRLTHCTLHADWNAVALGSIVPISPQVPAEAAARAVVAGGEGAYQGGVVCGMWGCDRGA
jgi:hypothetical protein